MHDIRMLRDQLDRLRAGMARRGKEVELAPLLDRAESLERDGHEITLVLLPGVQYYTGQLLDLARLTRARRA